MRHRAVLCIVLSRIFSRTRFGRHFLLLLLLSLSRCGMSAFASSHQAPIESYRIVHTYPHDPSAFTQGLVYVDGMLYEGTGLNGRSSIRMVDLKTGRVLQEHDLPENYFGEGLTDWGNNLIELTWQSHIGFVYDRFSFRVVKTFIYEGEGWGLTHDSKHLILSDGTSVLRLLDPVTFQPAGQITVTDGGKPVMNLNELEYVHGEIYANVWQTDRIARISPVTGKVIAWVNLVGLLPSDEERNSDAVLNGIAYDSKRNRLFVTGKLWPKLFEIKLKPFVGSTAARGR
ncbi:MAG TPA: glutaminyl-peptide cyclotransferase [Acidobacteriaceae bacterium]|nr:glutaminyl-peptide cyclotransferase [Acidobacteriaceae bacterium]